MNGLVFSSYGKLFLNTSQTQADFAKSRLSTRMQEEGTMAVIHGNGWIFSPWAFTGTEELTVENRTSVFLSSPSFEGKTLRDFLDAAQEKSAGPRERADAARAAGLAVTVIETAIKAGEKIPCNGADGMFISSDFTGMIFLPQGIFASCADFRGQEQSASGNSLYLNEFMQGDCALRFLQASIAYKALTGNIPYAERDARKRGEDILDRNYLPLRSAVWALDKDLSDTVDKILSLKPSQTASFPPQKNQFPLRQLFRELGLASEEACTNGEELLSVIRKGSVSQETFDARVKKERRRFDRTLRIKRWLRARKSSLIAAGAALIAVMLAGISYWSSQQSKSTTKGLSCEQTVSMFYSAFNMLDIDGAQICGEKSSVSTFTNIIGNVYVSSKARGMYIASTSANSTVTPALWLSCTGEFPRFIFGLTQFSVDGKKQSLFFRGPKRKDSPRSITEEAGSPVREGDIKDRTAHYFLVHTQDEDSLSVLEYTDTLSLVFKSGRWRITSLTHTQTEPEVILSLSEFQDRYSRLLEENGGNVLKATADLRETYPWLSTNSEILEAAQ